MKCFLEYWTGATGSSEKCLKSADNVEKISASESESVIENNFKVVPIHRRQKLLDETIKLINSHWPQVKVRTPEYFGNFT